jgi:hypothetical protein
MASISVENDPARVRSRAARYPQPVALLARLGVTIGHEGRGLGAGLLADVISRTAQLDAGIGYRGLLAHAETPQARDFHPHLIPEFEPSPTDDLHLILLMKTFSEPSTTDTRAGQRRASRGALGARENEQRRKPPGDDERR